MHIYSVSEFIESVNEIIGGIFVIEGEVSGYNVNQNKWIFFNLKEDGAVVSCFLPIWKLHQPVEDGMQIRVVGKPEVFKKSGRFSVVVETIELVGQGSLERAFKLLKEKLTKEGLFASERKRALPEFPERIGLITSAGAAAYTDFLRIAKNRFGGMDFLLYQVRVQGDGAAEDIAKAFSYFNEMLDPPEALVLIRGGGSLEDLQAFNTEIVARAVFGSRMPVVVGIGHERDLTIADYVADVRASTPSNAAEILFRDRTEVGEAVVKNIAMLSEQLDHEVSRRKNDIQNCLTVLIDQFERPMKRIEEHHNFLLQYFRQVEQNIVHWKEKIDATLRLMFNIDPQHLLSRGFSIARYKGNILKTTAGLKIGDAITTELGKGSLVSQISKIETYGEQKRII